jgi:tetratricopeptide (TPR) repeat protein
MKSSTPVTVALITLVLILTATPAIGAGSSTITSDTGRDIRLYNQGVALMLDKDFSAAERKFRQALAENDRLAEAHNNLAYVLRKQGPENFEEALKHYNRAISLKAYMAQPYMYRGVLFVQMGSLEKARADLETLEGLDASLARELAYVIANGREKEPEQFFGVSETLR